MNAMIHASYKRVRVLRLMFSLTFQFLAELSSSVGYRLYSRELLAPAIEPFHQRRHLRIAHG